VSYDLMMAQIVQPMRDELTTVGFQELREPEAVDAALKSSGTTFVFVNSVCGCAGGVARPAAAMALTNKVVPDHIVTVFAGQDREATERARSYFEGYNPSSPSMAIMKDGKIVTMIERHQIEGRYPDDVAADLVALFDKYCGEAN